MRGDRGEEGRSSGGGRIVSRGRGRQGGAQPEVEVEELGGRRGAAAVREVCGSREEEDEEELGFGVDAVDYISWDCDWSHPIDDGRPQIVGLFGPKLAMWIPSLHNVFLFLFSFYCTL